MSDFDALQRILQARHSCRAFRPDAVPRDTIARIVAAAQRVPSWCNSQPWQLTVLSGAATAALADRLTAGLATEPHAPDFPFPDRYTGIYRDRRSTCGWQLYDAVGVTRGDRAGSAREMARNFRFFDAPHVAIVTSPAELGLYGAVDCGAFVTGFALAAQALGIGTVAQAAIAGYAPVVRAHLGLPEDRRILCAISFGYPDPDHPANGFRTDRASPDEVVDWRDEA